MDIDDIAERLITIAVKAVKQQRREALAKIRLLDGVEKMLREFVKQTKAQHRAWRKLSRKPLETLPFPKA